MASPGGLVTVNTPGVIVPSPQSIDAVKFQAEVGSANPGSLKLTPVSWNEVPAAMVWSGSTATVGAT